jgi:hypothetical protein
MDATRKDWYGMELKATKMVDVTVINEKWQDEISMGWATDNNTGPRRTALTKRLMLLHPH